MLKLFTMGSLKTYITIIGVALAVWFFKDYKHQIRENIRQTENVKNLRRFDSLKFATQTYSKRELNDYLEHNRKDLLEFLDKQDVKIKRIQQIISQKQVYRDTADRSINLQPIIEAINEKKNAILPVIDSTECLIIRGVVVLEGDSLRLNIKEREFKNETDIVRFIERNQWKFLGIKTRFLGKRELNVTVNNSCGETKTFIINKKNIK